MTKNEIYEKWRPTESPWSGWVKPVLFSYLPEHELTSTGRSARNWDVPVAGDAAIIADLPGGEGVEMGAALLKRGYRPIPVYNASPFETHDSESSGSILPRSNRPDPDTPVVVDMLPILSALCGIADELAAADLPVSAPPVFLLDANRRGSSVAPPPGWFDNRSFVTPTDFPSADFFKQHKVDTVVLIQEQVKIEADLLHVLLTLQADGMTIARQTPWKDWTPLSVKVERPHMMLRVLEWLRRFGYRRDQIGGFGALVRPSSS
jgi:hypothetical protein